MIDIKKLRLYPFFTNNLAFTKSDDDQFYNIIFYPENTTFAMSYSKMQIPKRFIRYGTILPYTLPRIIVNPKTLTQFYSNKILPIRMNKAFVSNLFIDTSVFIEQLDTRFKKGSYRRSAVLSKIFDYLTSVKALYPNRKNVLLYYVDINQPVNDVLWFRRVLPLYMMFRSKEGLPFDYILLGIQSEGVVRYSLLAKPDGHISPSRFFSIVQAIRPVMLANQTDVDSEKETEFSKHVINTVQANYEQQSTVPGTEVKPIVNNKMQRSVKSYIGGLSEEERNSVLSQAAVHPEDANKLTIASTLYSVTHDKKKSIELANSIKPQNHMSAIKTIKNELAPTILEEDSHKNKSRDVVFNSVDLNGINENKNPSKTLNKRKVDFHESFESDLKRSFKLLGSKSTFPLVPIKFEKKQVPVDPGDLEPTKIVRYTITLQDEFKKTHEVVIDLPEIQSDGTFLINGSKKYLIYQLIIDPIFFLKPTEAKLETMFSAVATHHKLTKHKSYFNSYIAGYELPTFLVLAYATGFDETCKLFGIQYSIVNEKPEDKKVKVYELGDGKFMVFTFNTPEAEILINSLYEISGVLESKDIGSKESFQNLLIKQTDNRNCIFQIDSVLDNIMEPIALQILKTKLLPTTFAGCIHYICKGLATGNAYQRNDISKQRIRSSEIFNYQIQKLILGSYNEYRQKREHGDKDAAYYCDAKQIVSNIVNSSRMIRPLENINPYEELSSLTRVTPIGPGALEDNHSVVKTARNINASYFGNFEPMDTPENENIGVLNQLTLDAAIGNSRGSFGKFEGEDIKSSVLSPVTAVIPFVSSDDGCRVMLGTSQAKQAIPVLGAEPPLVQTGFETVMTSMLTDSYIRKSPVDGEVIRQSENIIVVKDSKTGKQHVVPLDSKVLRSAQGKSALNYFTTTVKDGQKVKAGQILAEGKHIKDGTISVGGNLLTAVMGWKGYAFEDGYIISEKIANQKFVSTSYEEIIMDITTTSSVKFIAKEGQETKKGDILIVRSSKEVEDLLNVDEDELVEGQQVKRSPGGKIIAIEVYSNVNIKKFPILEPQYTAFKKRWEEMKGPFPEKFITNDQGSKKPFSGVRVVFKIERYDHCVVGDKIANNHGGKGVLTLIEKNENMPVTPWGEPVDVILNPVAIVNRMNLGTLYEMYTGLVAKFLSRQLVIMGPVKSQKAMRLLTEIFTSMDATKDKSLSRNILRSFAALSDKQYAEYIKKLSGGHILPIIVPPFQSPSKEMIYKTMQLAGLKSAYNLKLPEFKMMTKNPVAVGYLYYKKLEQQAEYKISARSIGKYATATSQPIAGAAQGGGQRLGEFDTWSIAAHGAETLLKELLGTLADDRKTKDEILFEIIQKGEAKYRDPKQGLTKSLLDVYLASMMLNAKL